MSLPGSIAHYWHGFQAELQEASEVEPGAPGERYEHLIQVFGFVRVEKFLCSDRAPGRSAKDRVPLARAFLVKAVFDLPTTRDLRERPEFDSKLRWLGSGTRHAERSNRFPRARGLRGGFAARTTARSARSPEPGRSPCGDRLAGLDGGRGAAETGCEGPEAVP